MRQVGLPYHIRVLVPCYREDLEIVQRTVLAALDADLPAGCGRTVYLCDDGRVRGLAGYCLCVSVSTHRLPVRGRALCAASQPCRPVPECDAAAGKH